MLEFYDLRTHDPDKRRNSTAHQSDNPSNAGNQAEERNDANSRAEKNEQQNVRNKEVPRSDAGTIIRRSTRIRAPVRRLKGIPVMKDTRFSRKKMFIYIVLK